MPRRVRQRRRGKGSPNYRAPSHRFKGMVTFKTYDDIEKTSSCTGKILELLHDTARSSPLMIVRFSEQTVALPAPMGVMKGGLIECGATAPIETGNYLPLKSIPEGTLVSNIELTPGDGGKIARSAGAKARIVSKESGRAMIKLSSKGFKTINENCRAMIGVIAGGGHKVKPLVKAGTNHHKKKAKGRRWPTVRGCARNALEHPHGGKQKRMRKSKTVSRHAPPGAKVGSIAPRRTGRGGKK